MLMPSAFGENLLGDFFDYSFGSHKVFDMMDTDIRDTKNGYEMTTSMPGARREDVGAEPKDGYLVIQATADSSRNEKDSNGAYIHRERYCGSCNGSFYVGDAVTQGDIKAKLEDGTSKMLAPRKETRPAVEEKKYTAIKD